MCVCVCVCVCVCEKRFITWSQGYQYYYYNYCQNTTYNTFEDYQRFVLHITGKYYRQVRLTATSFLHHQEILIE